MRNLVVFSALAALVAAPALAVVSMPTVVSDVCDARTHVGLCTVVEYDGSMYAISYRDMPQVYQRPNGLTVRGYNNCFDQRTDVILRVVRLL